MITISLCMIVKNEEAVLARCLDSVKEVVDEIVIVDTGSTDKTKEIAAQYTGLVYDFAWDDDFSAARNASFSRATKDFILWLDADDVLLPADRQMLGQLKQTLPCDIDVVMNHFTAPVRWCLCPRSNRYISRLEPPVELLRCNRLDICLGTDSLASNDRLSVFEEMRMFPEVPLPELLSWAAEGGARALDMDAELGEVAPGRRCGLTVISGLDYDTMRLTPASRIRRIL